MKTFFLTLATIFILTASYGFMKSETFNNDYDPATIKISTLINDKEIELLKHMREEEKLARDVYKNLYDKYKLNVFNNIMKAEQTHMDAILGLLNQYNIADPALGKYGIFNNPDLQKLYDQLVAQGNQSITEALKVGATIEDVDIKDLMEYRKDTTNPDILAVLDNLTCGSRNHMRAFVSNLATNNATYTPQFISIELYNSIINGSHEKCGQNGNGKGNGNGRMSKNKGKGNGDCKKN